MTALFSDLESNRLGELYVGCLLAAASRIVFDIESDFVTFVQSWDARTLERRGMNKNVLAAVVGRNKSETFGTIEKFYGAILAHGEILFPCQSWNAGLIKL